MQKTAGSVRTHTVSTVISLIVGSLTGTFIPMLENWHSDKMNSEQIAAVAAQGQRETDQLRNDLKDFEAQEAARSRALWDVVGSKQDKTKSP